LLAETTTLPHNLQVCFTSRFLFNPLLTIFAAASQAGLPTVAADGSITMTLHQVNGDGAGFVSHSFSRLFSFSHLSFRPYTCDVSADGGNTFQAATVTQQVPGKNGRSKAKATDFALTAQIPAYAFFFLRQRYPF
jgi:hypothetical protein